MGSMTGSILSLPREPRCAPPSSWIRARRTERVGPAHACRPHHVENPGGEAEQQKHDHSPWRDSKPLVEKPPNSGTDQDPGNQLGRQSKTTSHRRGIARRSRTRITVGRTARTEFAEPFA